MDKLLKYSIFAIFSLVITFGVFIGSSNLSASPAQADTTCGTTSVCISIHKGWVGNNSQGGNGLGSGPGGGGTSSGNSTVTKPTPIPCISASNVIHVAEGESMPYATSGWRTMSGCKNEFKIKTTFVPFAKPGGWCSIKKQNGEDIKAVGYINNYIERIQFAQKVTGSSGDDLNTKLLYSYKPHSTAQNCIYPKVNSITKNQYCALSTNVVFDRLANSRAGAKRIKNINKTITTVAKLQSGSGVCKQSENISFTSGIKNTADNWGQYKLGGTIKYAKCSRVITQFDGKVTTEYAKCKTAGSASAVAYATLWCGGSEAKRLNKTWTMNDCFDRAKGGYKCTVPKPTFDGKTGTVQTIRDGKNRVLNWGAPKVGSSVRNTSGWEQTVTIAGGSSPRNTSVSDNNKSRQYFWSNVPFSKSWSAKKNSQNLAFYNASNPNGTWKATKNLRFDAQFKTTVGDITSYNPWTGKMNLKNRTVWVKDYNIKCQSATSPSIQVLRSIGDVQ